MAYSLLDPVPSSLDLSKLDVLDSSLISDVMRIASIQLPNPLHRYSVDTARGKKSSESDNLRKIQREIDNEISEVNTI